VPVDPLPNGSRSAFASAVANQDFALANLLLQHGANINFSYPYQRELPWVAVLGELPWATVLGELVQNPTGKGVESVKYLLGISGRAKPAILALPTIPGQTEEGSSVPSSPLPDFIVDKQSKMTVFHYAACSIPKTKLESMALGQMVRYILSEKTYSDAEVINFYHPDGTALWVATSLCNLEVVEALLEKGADATTPFKGHTALTIAQTMVANLGAWEKPGMDRATKKQILKRFTLIVELLRNVPTNKGRNHAR